MIMIRTFIHKIKNAIVTLRFSILIVFVTFFIFSMLTIITITYIRFSESAAFFTKKLMDQTSQSVFQEIIGHDVRGAIIATDVAKMLLEQGMLNPADLPAVSGYTLSILRLHARPIIQSAFWGTENGSVEISAKQKDGQFFITEIIDTTKDHSTHEKIYYSATGNTIKKTQVKNPDYDPRLRQWYIDAKQTKKSIITGLFKYKFFDRDYWGITIAAPVYDKAQKLLGVFATNIRIDFLRKYVEGTKISEHSVVFIVMDDGRLVAYPYLDQVTHESLTDIHALNLP